jgi:hypothetical protein
MSSLEVGVEHAIREVPLVEGDPKIPDWKWVPEPKDVVVYVKLFAFRRGRLT